MFASCVEGFDEGFDIGEMVSELTQLLCSRVVIPVVLVGVFGGFWLVFFGLGRVVGGVIFWW